MERVKKRRRLVRIQQLEDVQELKRRILIRRHQLEDVPELIQQIQSLLPPDQAARTCVMSKSWLHAFSTTPALRFQPVKLLNKQQQGQYMRLINRTLRRYHIDNLPIITFDLHFGIPKQKSASRAEKWIKVVTSKACLKELCLTILPDIPSFTFPDDIFASEKLIKLSLINLDKSNNNSLHICSNTVINCVNLRVLELLNVHISEELLHNLLSTCKLLEKINLKLPEGLEKIKVNNLLYLHELRIAPRNQKDNLEVSNVPSLHSFFYDLLLVPWMPALSNMNSIGSLRELSISYMPMDDAFSDLINSKFPYLESLTLALTCCTVETLDIRCASLRRLKIRLMQKTHPKVHVCSPKLLFLHYECSTIPDFFFPSATPEQIELRLILCNAVDHMFFLKMRDSLNLSSKFKIELKFYGFMVPYIDDVRRRIMFPAKNVEYLLFEAYDKDLCNKSSIIDVLFCVCHPNYMEVNHPLTLIVASYLLKLNKKETMEKETGEVCLPQLKSGEIRNPDGRLETLASSSISLLDESCEFKLNWRSP